MVAVVDVALVGAVVAAPHGVLSMEYVPLFDFFVLSELLAVSLLTPVYVFFVAAVNSAFIFGDLLLQPKSLELSQLMATSDRYVFIIRPIACAD